MILIVKKFVDICNNTIFSNISSITFIADSKILLKLSKNTVIKELLYEIKIQTE